ncbi:MAG: protein kinase [Caldisericia bacterium]|nr:protein kinase [Caldisericia bacterium]
MLIAGRYELKQKLGEGGMGQVYLAYDKVKKRECAIKLLTTTEGVSDENRKRFIREILILSGISHPSIVKFFESGEHGNSFYYTMEYINGESINSQKNKLGIIIDYLIQVTSALGELHKKGIVHRDIKPGNILVSDGKAMIVDFGIAHHQADSARLTRTGNVIGTASYMAPEQVMGREIDGRLDIYSLGVVLYELLTGVTLFAGGDIVAQIYKIIEEQPKLPRIIDPEIPKELEKICMKCLQKNPDQRYKNTTGLIIALKNFQKGIKTEGVTMISTSSKKYSIFGREKIIENLKSLLDSITTGESHSLQLIGSNGMGKSRMLAELQSMALSKKIKYLSCNPEFIIEGVSAISNLLAEMSQYDITPDLEKVKAHAGLIRLISPHFADKLGLPSDAKSQKEEAKAEIIAELILKSFEGRTVVFGFENNLDQFSLAVMEEMVKRKASGKLIVSAIEHGVTNAFEESITLTLLTKRQLASLAHEVLGHQVSVFELDALVKRTDGNPMFAIELLKSSKKSDKDITVTSLPQSITDILASKFRNLSKDPREILIKMSLIGKPLPMSDLKAIVRYPDKLFGSSITRLINDGLVKERNIGKELYFIVSGVISDTVMIEVKSETKQRYSLELAGTLEIVDSEKYALEIGEHYIISGRFEKGVNFVAIAGLTAIQSMNQINTKRATDLFLDRVEELQDINTKVKAYLCLIGYYRQLGDLKKTMYYLDLVGNFKGVEHVDVVTRREFLITQYILSVRNIPTRKLLSITEELLKISGSDAPLRSQYMAFTLRGSAFLRNRNPEEALKWDKKALEVAEKTKNSNDWCGAINNLALGNIELGKYDKAIEYLEKLRLYAEKNYEIYFISSALINLAHLHSHQKDWDKAREHFNEAFEFTIKHKQYSASNYCLLQLTQIGLILLRLDDARESINKNIELHKIFNMSIDGYIGVIERLICLAILDDDKKLIEKYNKQMNEIGLSLNNPEYGSNKYISQVEYALAKLDYKKAISVCKKFDALYGELGDSPTLLGNQILLVLWESFVSVYTWKTQKASTLFEKAKKLYEKDDLKNNLWISRVMDIVTLANEIADVRRAYGGISKIIGSDKRRESVTKTFSDLCKSVVMDKDKWGDTFFFFWPRLTWMIGNFALWLSGTDKNHPGLEKIMKDAIEILKNTVKYLKNNKLKAYIKELEEQRRELAWKLKK